MLYVGHPSVQIAGTIDQVHIGLVYTAKRLEVRSQRRSLLSVDWDGRAAEVQALEDWQRRLEATKRVSVCLRFIGRHAPVAVRLVDQGHDPLAQLHDVLLDGRLAEMGTHKQLAANTREFWSLFLAQGSHVDGM